MYSIGKINQKIYKCITEDIITEEVIITDNQIQHIKDRHPEAEWALQGKPDYGGM